MGCPAAPPAPPPRPTAKKGFERPQRAGMRARKKRNSIQLCGPAKRKTVATESWSGQRLTASAESAQKQRRDTPKRGAKASPRLGRACKGTRAISCIVAPRGLLGLLVFTLREDERDPVVVRDFDLDL